MPTPSLGLTYGTGEVENRNLRLIDHAIQAAPSAADLAALQSQLTALEARVAALEAAAP